jgi:long-chain acyl-CoA synthetase
VVDIDDDGYVRIIGRKKEILVLSNGENVPPAVIEQHLEQVPGVLQTMVVGEGQPFVVALVVPDKASLSQAWQREKHLPWPEDWQTHGQVKQWLLQAMQRDESDLASYMQVRDFVFVDEEWTQENGMLTPTLKLKRPVILEKYRDLVEACYSGDSTAT